MRIRKQFIYIFIFFIALGILFFSCKKEQNDDAELFYGSWKTSYNDTIVFFRNNGKNMLQYDVSLNPAMPSTSTYEYACLANKLGIKNGLSGPGNFHFLQSFLWLEKGKSFRVQGVEWFAFISSTQTYFTFTKIP
jgi:hypothetical protein